MRVVVATDALAGLSPAEASGRIARAFDERGAQVAVVPLGVEGAALAAAAAAAAPSADFRAVGTAQEVGEALAGDRPPGNGPTVLDLTRCAVDDLGRAALAEFAIDPSEALLEARGAWAERELVALVPQGDVARPLTGLDGYASTVLRARGATLQEILGHDAVAERWAAQLGLEPGPGAGAAGGVGLLIQALGGRVVDPLTWLGEQFRLERTLAQADLIVTGAEWLDFHDRGGAVVKQVVAWAELALRPVIAISGRNFISARELRLAGLEEAYALREGAGESATTPKELAEVAARVATSWLW